MKKNTRRADLLFPVQPKLAKIIIMQKSDTI